MTQAAFRLPAEWEPQAGVIIAWPHEDTDWAPRLAEVEITYRALAAAVTRFESLVICVRDEAHEAHVRAAIENAAADMARVRFVQVAYDDTWLRDSGPLTLVDGEGGYLLEDFRFTGWGGKFDATQDDALVAELLRQGVFDGRTHHCRVDWALEGGAVESDGTGTVLSTWRCLSLRHPGIDRPTLGRMLAGHLHSQRVLWLDHGYLQGDDTDAHIDTLARLAPEDGIVFQACDDPDDIHYDELARMHVELAALRTIDGRPYRLYALPWPRPILDRGRRLAASYANYLIVDGAVLVPAYDDPADAAAANIIATAHPDREVVGIPCRPLIWQNGSLHCITMQMPRGALA